MHSRSPRYIALGNTVNSFRVDGGCVNGAQRALVVFAANLDSRLTQPQNWLDAILDHASETIGDAMGHLGLVGTLIPCLGALTLVDPKLPRWMFEHPLACGRSNCRFLSPKVP